MPPSFDPDFTKARASIRIFPKGEYRLRVTEARPFAYVRDSDQKEIGGCKYFLTVVDGEFAGELVTPMNCYVHSENAWGMAKQFLMAAAGYGRKEEEKADAEFFSKLDFSVAGEGDDIQGGDGWASVLDNEVIVTLSSRLYEGQEQQDFRNWMPAA